MRMGKTGSAVLILVASTLVDRQVAAAPASDEEGIRIEWRGSDACPVDDFNAAVERYLATSSIPAEGRSARGSIETWRDEAGQWRLELRLETESGTSMRALEAPECETVSDAAAFVVAVAIDPSLADPGDAGEERDQAGSEPTAMVPMPPEAPAPGQQASASQSEARKPEPSPVVVGRGRDRLAEPPPRARGLLRAMGGIDGLALPSIGGMASAAAGAAFTGWQLEAVGGYRFATEARSTADPEAGGRIALWTVGARGCWVRRARLLQFPLCGGVEAGQQLGQGFGFDGARATRLPWVAIVASPGLRLGPWHALSLAMQPEIAVPLLHTEFVIEGLGGVHDSGPIALRGLFGVEVSFP